MRCRHRWTRGLLLGLCLSASAAAQDGKGAEAALRVAIPTLPPWSYYDADCRHTGIAIENLRRWAARAGVPIVTVPMPLESTESALQAADIDLFLGDERLNGPLSRSIAQPLGYVVETVAISAAVREGRPPAPRRDLRVGARTRGMAAAAGFGDADIREGEVSTTLAGAYVRGELDVLVGGREVLYFALLRRGVPVTELREQTALLGSRTVSYRLFPAAEARWGERLRAGAQAFDWKRSDAQLRQRFLSADSVRGQRDAASCERDVRFPEARSNP